MRRILLTAVATLMMLTSASAQRLTNVMAEAQFITDKMIVELGLNSSLRNSILQVNIGYLNGIDSYRDIDSDGWRYRNRRLKAMLSDKQWKMYKKAGYFYRPIGWRDNAYVHNIYARYPKDCRGKDFRRMPPPPRDRKFDKSDKPKFKDRRFDERDRRFERKDREFRNNSPEAIRMRKEMRRGMPGAR